MGKSPIVVGGDKLDPCVHADHIGQTIANNLKMIGYHIVDSQAEFWFLGVKRRIEHNPQHRSSIDLARTPGDDDAALDLLTKTSGAQAAIAHLKKVAALTH